MKRIRTTLCAIVALCALAAVPAQAGWFGGNNAGQGGNGQGLGLLLGDPGETPCPYGTPQDGTGAGPGDGTQPRPQDGTGFGSPWTQNQ